LRTLESCSGGRTSCSILLVCTSDHRAGGAYTWAYHRTNPAPVIQRIENDLLPDVKVLEFDFDCAKEFGKEQGQLLQQGISVSPVDLWI